MNLPIVGYPAVPALTIAQWQAIETVIAEKLMNPTLDHQQVAEKRQQMVKFFAQENRRTFNADALS